MKMMKNEKIIPETTFSCVKIIDYNLGTKNICNQFFKLF